MPSMEYCRHENTAREMGQVWDLWDDFDPDSADEYETKGRARIIRMVREMHNQFVDDEVYRDLDDGTVR